MAAKVYDDLFSGVDLLPTLLGLLGIAKPDDIEGISHAQALLAPDSAKPVRDHVYTSKTYHDSFDPIRAIRTKDFSYIENYAHRPLLDLPWDIEESPSGHAVAPLVKAPRPERELYDLRTDPAETDNLLAGDGNKVADAIAADLAVRLHDWRQQTGDVIPSEFAGSRIAARYTETYLQIHEKTPTSRSAIASDRGIEDEVRTPINSCVQRERISAWWSRNADAHRCLHRYAWQHVVGRVARAIGRLRAEDLPVPAEHGRRRPSRAGWIGVGEHGMSSSQTVGILLDPARRHARGAGLIPSS